MDEYKPRKAPTRPRNLRGPNGLKLKQVDYRSFPHNITIYHFQANYTSVLSLRTLFNRADHGYVDTLLSSDPILSLKTLLPEDDVIPKGRVEVAYLPDVFYLGGSALGFRMNKGMVHWMCFDQPIDQTILQRTISGKPRNKDSPMLFDHVGMLSKRVEDHKGTYLTSEHRGWHHSLKVAYRRPIKLTLKLNNSGEAERADHDGQLKERAREERKLVVRGFGLEYQGFVPDNVQTTTQEDTGEKGQEHAYRLMDLYDSYTDKTPTQEAMPENENVRVESTRARSKTPYPRPYISPPKSDVGMLGN